jgi:hypothetical protein
MSDLNAPGTDDGIQGDEPPSDVGPLVGEDDSPPDPMRTPAPPD